VVPRIYFRRETFPGHWSKGFQPMLNMNFESNFPDHVFLVFIHWGWVQSSVFDVCKLMDGPGFKYEDDIIAL